MESTGGERGANWKDHTRESSIDTRSMLHPAAAAGICAAAVGLAAAWWLSATSSGGNGGATFGV